MGWPSAGVGLLVECGARVTVISPELTPHLEHLANRGLITHHRRSYEPGDSKHAHLVLSATGDPRVNQAVWDEARCEGTLVNTADEPDHCDFIMPAVVRQGDLTIAISTDGKSPALAVRLREKLTRTIGPEYGRLLELLGRVRPRIHQQCGNTEQRKNIHYRIVDSDILALIRKRDERAIEQRLEEITGRLGPGKELE